MAEHDLQRTQGALQLYQQSLGFKGSDNGISESGNQKLQIHLRGAPSITSLAVILRSRKFT
jgi:hypothetical protein